MVKRRAGSLHAGASGIVPRKQERASHTPRVDSVLSTEHSVFSTARSRAFTMVEMLTVMAIIAFLASTLIIMVPLLRERAMKRSTEATFRRIQLALDRYKQDCGMYPWWIRAPISNGAMLAAVLTYKYPVYDGATDVPYGGWLGASSEWFYPNDLRVIGRSVPPTHELIDAWMKPIEYIPATRYGSLRNILLVYQIIGGTSYATRGVWIDGDDNGANTASGDGIRYGTLYYPPGSMETSGSGSVVTDFMNIWEVGTTGSYRTMPAVAPKAEWFYNTTTYQLWSRGSDGGTDTEDGTSASVGAFDAGLDTDDINNFERP